MSIKWDQPIQTRDGRPVRVLCTDRKGAGLRPVIALLQNADGSETELHRHLDGRAERDARCCDIINVPMKHTQWLNVYSASMGYQTKELADKYAVSGRIACIEVEFAEGEGL